MRAVNLIPAQQRGGGASVGAGRSEGGAYAVIALVCGLAVMAFMYGTAHHEVSSKEGKAAEITAQVTQTQAQATALAPYTSFVALREQRTQAATSLVDTRFDWAHVFHEFARVLPVTVSISSLSGTVGSSTGTATATAAAPAAAGASTVASATPPGSVPAFTLNGCATTQQEVARMLTRLRLMDGVASVTLQTSSKGGSTGTGGAAGAAAGACPATGPVFAAQITFDPLPTPPASVATTKTVAVTTSAPAAASTGTVTP
jgi:Tfp pilus assembly protein PilN